MSAFIPAVSSERIAPTTAPATSRYDAVSIALHWSIAALVVLQLGLGWTLNELVPDHSPVQAQILSVHISTGATILILTLARIGWRLANPAPPLPADMPLWERVFAGATHVLFYVLLLALPLTGWAIVSIHPGAMHVWGIPWPKLPGLGFMATPDHKAWRRELTHIHVYILIWIALITLVMHVAGALWRQFAGHSVLWRMAPLRILKR
jgi:cytochrome b561